jgi:capsular exopolysaccharide synthesis family protein
MREPLPLTETEPYGAAQDLPADYAADVRRTWHALIERAWIVPLCLVISLALGFAYLRRAPVLYSATATLQVQQDQAPVFKIDNVQFQDLQALDFLQTIAQTLKTRPLLARVAESNNLAANPRFFSTAIKPAAGEDLVGVLDRLTTVKLRRGTRLIDVTVKHSDPHLTDLLANSLVDEFISDNAEQHSSNSAEANTTLSRQAEILRNKLQESEAALQTYRETNSEASSLDDRQNTVVAALKELSTKVTEAKSARIKLESEYNQVLALGDNPEALVTLPTVAANVSVLAAKQNLLKEESEFAGLKQRYKEKHPKYIQAQTQLAALRNDLAQSILKAAQGPKASLDAARASEAALESALRTQEASALDLNKLSIQYGVLSRGVESDRALYESVLKTVKETLVSKDIKPMRIRVVQPAFTPKKPFSPRRAMVAALSGLGGIFAGFLLVLCLNFLDTSIKTVDEAETLLRFPVLATVSDLKEVKKKKHPLVVLEDAQSSGAEAFRTLRTSLSMLGRVEDRRVFLFTSSMPEEGKTFCSLNYAASLAQLGLKVLLIDGDLRKPSVEIVLMGKDQGTPGVTDYLTGRKSFEEVVQPCRLPGLFFISGGTTAPNPAELLAKDGLAELIERALKSYDRVVLDSAPVHAVSDTLLMLKNVQTVCLIVRCARTSTRSVARCVHLLKGAQAPLSGLVLNRMPLRRKMGYGYYYYSPYYDYRYHGKYNKKGVYGS